MNRRPKTFAISIAIIIVLFTLASFFLNMGDLNTIHKPPDFYYHSREVSLDEMVDIANGFNLSIYLPSELPNNLELTAIYLRDNDFLAIVAYSAEGNEDYKTAEFGIQISPLPPEFTPTYDDLRSEAETSEYKTALEINSWPVLINEKANWGGNEEAREKYGDYVLHVQVWIDGMEYNIGAPTLNVETTVELVESMNLFTP
ncbi:MAG: hypothetical protein JSV23_01725 [Promethearchaeota archaeon]|nr:MAG: hypothetical protein JSV23_01725 [Candidatus Lokiarchaeota archaeon]